MYFFFLSSIAQGTRIVLVCFFYHMGSSASEKPHGDMEWVDFVPTSHTSFLQVITHKASDWSINFVASVVSCRKRRITYYFPVQTPIRFGQRQQIHFYQEQKPWLEYHQHNAPISRRRSATITYFLLFISIHAVIHSIRHDWN